MKFLWILNFTGNKEDINMTVCRNLSTYWFTVKVFCVFYKLFFRVLNSFTSLQKANGNSYWWLQGIKQSAGSWSYKVEKTKSLKEFKMCGGYLAKSYPCSVISALIKIALGRYRRLWLTWPSPVLRRGDCEA